MPKYYFPKSIICGSDANQFLRSLSGHSVGIITDRPVMEKTGILHQVVDALQEKNPTVNVIGSVEREPTFTMIQEISEAATEYHSDLLIALGGGSVIDVAKTVRILKNHPGSTLDHETGKFTYQTTENIIQSFIAIPTTSGTGSEVTPFAVVIDDAHQVKRVLISSELMPDYALLDPTFTKTMPKALTADTGFDVLSHAIESYVCTCSNEFSAPYALQATKLALEHLGQSYAEPDDLLAREKVQKAATLAGIAIANSAAGLMHRMDQIGPLFKMSHGRTLAILFPYVMQYNAQSCKDKFAELASHVGLPGSTQEDRYQTLFKRILELREQLAIPHSLRDAGVDKTQLLDHVDALSEEAISGLSAEFNPRILTAAEVRDVFLDTYEGILKE